MIALITPEYDHKNEHRTLNTIATLGDATFHIRKPRKDYRSMQEYFSLLTRECRKKAVLHTHYNLAAEYGCLGVHYPEREWRRLPACSAQSIALHNLSDINHSHDVRYSFLSPIFNSISKEGYGQAFSFNDVRAALSKTSNIILALGGVSIDNLPFVKELGFSGIALCGAVWKDEKPAEVYKTIENTWKSLTSLA